MARNSEMKKAVCWEMVAAAKGVEGFRVIVADRFLLTQTLEAGNERPRWVIEDAGTPAQATQRAVAVTDFVEQEYAARLAVDPAEVVVHDAELKSLHAGDVSHRLLGRGCSRRSTGRSRWSRRETRQTGRGIRGVAWVMGGPPNTHIPSLLIAVAGTTVILRHPDGKWRSGAYMNEDEAEKSATLTTEKEEHNGKHLVNGPAEFFVDHDNPETDTLHSAILTALNLL